jgi:hypothetical protein
MTIYGPSKAVYTRRWAAVVTADSLVEVPDCPTTCTDAPRYRTTTVVPCTLLNTASEGETSALPDPMVSGNQKSGDTYVHQPEMSLVDNRLNAAGAAMPSSPVLSRPYQFTAG